MRRTEDKRFQWNLLFLSGLFIGTEKEAGFRLKKADDRFSHFIGFVVWTVSFGCGDTKGGLVDPVVKKVYGKNQPHFYGWYTRGTKLRSRQLI